MFIVIYLLHSQTRNVMPKHDNTIIKQHLCGEGLPSLLSLLQVDVFQQQQGILQQIILCPSNKPKKLVSGLLIQIISPKVLQENTTILQLKVYIVYVMRNFVGHPPQQQCPINLALFFFPFVYNARSLDHHFFTSFSNEFSRHKVRRVTDPNF